MRLKLVVSYLFLALCFAFALRTRGQDSAIGPGTVFRITPSSLPIKCNNGDLRFDTLTSQLEFCNSNTWNPLAGSGGIPAPTPSSLGGVFNQTAATNFFLYGVDTAGNLLSAQPTFSNIAGTASSVQLPVATNFSVGAVMAFSPISHQWINQINAFGSPSSTQPIFTDISGTAASAQLPNPTTAAIGGVMAFAAVAHSWINQINTNGSPSATQPSCNDLSNAAASCSIDATQFSNMNGSAIVTQGGTGRVTLTNHGVLVGAGTAAITQLTAAGTGVVLSGAGTGSDPTWTANPTISSVLLAGSTSGTVSQIVSTAAGTWNFFMPTSAGSSGQFLTSQGGTSPMTWTTGSSGSTNLTVTAVTANYTALSTDYAILAGNTTSATSSFTVTLPSSSTGKEYCIIDLGVSLAQNISIAAAAGNIGTVISGGYILNTFGESLCVFFDATNWQIRSHITAGFPLTFVPTVQGYGTVTSPVVNCQRYGNYLTCQGSLISGTPTSTAAWSMAIPVTIDTTYLNPSGNTTAQQGMLVGFLQGNGGANAEYNIVLAPGTSTTKIYNANMISGTTQLIPQTANTGIVAGNTVSFWFRIPVQGWMP